MAKARHKAGKTGWGKPMVSSEYHPKTELFHDGKEEILKERLGQIYFLKHITLVTMRRMDSGRTNRAWAKGTLQGTVPGIFNVYNQQNSVIILEVRCEEGWRV